MANLEFIKNCSISIFDHWLQYLNFLFILQTTQKLMFALLSKYLQLLIEKKNL